ncbi:MAG: hypothetical protein ACRD0K_23915 [Egibacteraceae bacterium]
MTITSLVMVSGPAAAQSPPAGCVVASVSGDLVSVANTCPFEQRVKVLVAFGPDSACVTMSSGGNFSHRLEPFTPFNDARFDGLVAC